MSAMLDAMLNRFVLGFDFGLRRIGVALGQAVTKTAKPLNRLLANQGKPDWRQILKLIDEWQPAALIVGLPLNMDGSEQAITQAARFFAEELKRQTHLPVYLVDERLTTLEARQQIFSQQGYRGLQQAQVDSVAAALIVEQWLQQMPDERLS